MTDLAMTICIAPNTTCRLIHFTIVSQYVDLASAGRLFQNIVILITTCIISLYSQAKLGTKYNMMPNPYLPPTLKLPYLCLGNGWYSTPYTLPQPRQITSYLNTRLGVDTGAKQYA